MSSILILTFINKNLFVTNRCFLVDENNHTSPVECYFCAQICPFFKTLYLHVCVYFLGRMTASDTLTWLKTHGTAVDNSNFVSSMLSSGQKVVLTGRSTMSSLCLSELLFVFTTMFVHR